MRTYRLVSLFIALTMLLALVPVTTVGAQEGRTYILVEGDTLMGIAEKRLGDVKYVTAIMEATNAKAEEDGAYTKLHWIDEATQGDQVYLPSAEEADEWLKTYNERIMSLEEFRSKDWTIGFSNASETNNFRTAMRIALDEFVADRYPNVKIIRTDANDQPAKQLADLEDLLAQEVDALIISAVTTDVANPILDRATAQDVPIVVLDRPISGGTYECFVGADFYPAAVGFITALLEKLGGEGDFVIVDGLPGAGPAILHSQGYDDVLPLYPDINVVARQAGNWSRQSGFEAMENILSAVPEFDGMIGDGGEQLSGQIDALIAAGWTEDQLKALVMGGQDNHNGYLKLIKQGIVDVGNEHSPYENGYLGGEAAVLALRGAYVPKSWYLKWGLITTDTPEDEAYLDKLVHMDEPDDYWLLPADLMQERLYQPWMPEDTLAEAGE